MASIGLGYGGYQAGAYIGSFFGPVGTLIGAAVGGAVGAFAGSYIDQTYLYPAIFGKEGSASLHGPRIDDFQFTVASPGSPARFCIGPANRIPGTVIWMGPVQRKSKTEEIDGGGGGGKGGGGGQEVTTYHFEIDVAVAICEGPISKVTKVYADGSLIYDASAVLTEPIVDIRYTSIKFYPGSDTQFVDPLIESYQGLGEVPAFRGTAYMIIERLNLADWGNRLPNFTFAVEAQPIATLSDAVTNILLRGGRTIGEFDTTFLQGEEVKGYTITGLQSPLKSLEPLMLAFGVVAQEQSGVIFFSLRKDSEPIVIPADRLAAREEGGEIIRPLSITDSPGFELPGEVNVQYTDPAFYLQRASQRELSVRPSAPISQSVDLPITLSGDEARTIARRILWSSQAERGEVTVMLPPSQMHVLESDVLEVDGLRVRVTNVQRGSNYLLEVKGVTEQSHTLTVTATVEPPNIPPENPPVQPVEMKFVALDIPLLPNTPEPWRRLYHAAAAISPAARFRFAHVVIASAPDGNYDAYDDIEEEAILGELMTPFPTTGPIGYWDLETYIDIYFYEGQPSTKSENDVLSGQNMLYVGPDTGNGEVIQFCTVEQLDTYIFRLRKLLRGRRSTEDRMAIHGTVPKEYAVLLSGPGMDSYAFDADYQNHPKWFKIGGGAGTATQTPVGPVVRTARPALPFSPHYLRAYRGISSNDVTFKWIRRSKVYFTLFSSAGAPLHETTERYAVTIYAPDGVTVAREVLIHDDTEYKYTAADQLTDGHTPGFGTRKFDVAQMLDAGGLAATDNRGIKSTASFSVPSQMYPISG